MEFPDGGAGGTTAPLLVRRPEEFHDAVPAVLRGGAGRPAEGSSDGFFSAPEVDVDVAVAKLSLPAMLPPGVARFAEETTCRTRIGMYVGSMLLLLSSLLLSLLILNTCPLCPIFDRHIFRLVAQKRFRVLV